jgi:predicted nucleic acid-binding protein
LSTPSTSPRLLDTNILVHLIRNKAAGRHLDQTYGLSSAVDRPLICLVTVGECLSLAKQLGWGDAKQIVLHQLLNHLPIVDINDPTILSLYADIDVETKAAGNKLTKNDLWIAAAAASQAAELLTCDQDFAGIPAGMVQVTYVDPATLPHGL